jgi:hypothetical protein
LVQIFRYKKKQPLSKTQAAESKTILTFRDPKKRLSSLAPNQKDNGLLLFKVRKMRSLKT